MSSHSKTPTRTVTKPSANNQVVGNIQGPAGRLIVVRLEKEMCKLSGSAGTIPAAENDVGRFDIDGATYAVRRDARAGEPACGELSQLLTERELEIAALIAAGRLNKQIASQLLISEHTVSSYLNRIFSKLRVHNRSAVAAHYALWTSSLPRA